MESTAEGHVAGALLQSPLNGLVVNDSKSVELVFGQEIFGVVELFRSFEPAEQVVHFADGDNGVARARRGHVTCLFDLLPGYGSRHSNNVK